MDGLSFLRRNSTSLPFDLVLVDAFATTESDVTGIPASFGDEFCLRLAAVTATHGVVAVSLFDSSGADEFQRACTRYFEQRYVLRHRGTKDSAWFSWEQRTLIMAGSPNAGTSRKTPMQPLAGEQEQGAVASLVQPLAPTMAPSSTQSPVCVDGWERENREQKRRFSSAATTMSRAIGLPEDLGKLVVARFDSFDRHGLCSKSRPAEVGVLGWWQQVKQLVRGVLHHFWTARAAQATNNAFF
jgi:hypothetical protein